MCEQHSRGGSMQCALQRTDGMPPSSAPCLHESVLLALAVAEAQDRPNPALFQEVQRAVTPQNRSMLVDWFVDCAEDMGLHSETLFLAVDLLDRYLSSQVETTRWLQLLGAACIWVASKVEEPAAADAEYMVSLTEHTFSKLQLADMELRLLQAVQHGVVRPSVHTFLSTLLHVSHAEAKYGLPGPGCGACCPLCFWELCEQTCTPPSSMGLQQLSSPECCMFPARGAQANSLAHMPPGTCTQGYRPAGYADSDSPTVVQAMHSTSASEDFLYAEPLLLYGHAGLEAVPCGTSGCGPADVQDMAVSPTPYTAATVSNKPRLVGAPLTAALRQGNEHFCGASTAGVSQLDYVARLISECCLLDHQLLRFLPSQIAAACTMLARAMLGMPAWSPALAQVTGISSPVMLAEPLLLVADAYARARYDQKLVALHTRYGRRRNNVITLEPSPEAVQLVATCRDVLLAASPVEGPNDPEAVAFGQVEGQEDDAASSSPDAPEMPPTPSPPCAINYPTCSAAPHLSDPLIKCTPLEVYQHATTQGLKFGTLPTPFNPFLDSDSVLQRATLSSLSASDYGACHRSGLLLAQAGAAMRGISCPGDVIEEGFDQWRSLSETTGAFDVNLCSLGTAGPASMQHVSTGAGDKAPDGLTASVLFLHST